MAYVDNFIAPERQFRIFWPVPVRGHVGVDLNFRPLAFEVEQRVITWSLIDAPCWLSIDPITGLISGSCDEEGIHKGITLRLSRADQDFEDYVDRTFDLAIDNSKFLFVDPNGDDDNLGTIEKPLRTVSAAASYLSNSIGKTIYLRGGTQLESFTDPVNLFDKRDRPETDFHSLRGYPGESAVWDYGENGGWCLNCRGFLVSNLTVKNGARRNYSKGIWQSVHSTAITDCVFRDLSGYDNLGAIEIKLYSIPKNPDGTPIPNAEVITARNVCFNNYNKNADIGASANENSAGIITFTNSGGRGTDDFQVWILNSKFYGNPHGVKIKHAGLDRLVIQGNEFHSGGRDNFQGGSHKLAFRYNILVNSNQGQITPNGDNASGPEGFGGSLFEKNTIVYVNGKDPTWMLNIQKGCQAKHGVFRNNIFAQLDTTQRRLVMRLWEYQDDWTGQEIEIDYNCYFLANSATSTSFVVGGKTPGAKNFLAWKATKAGLGPLDINSTLADPQFLDAIRGMFEITSASPAATAGTDGTFCGAFTPDKIYGVVGVSDTTLLNMNQNTVALEGGC